MCGWCLQIEGRTQGEHRFRQCRWVMWSASLPLSDLTHRVGVGWIVHIRSLRGTRPEVWACGLGFPRQGDSGHSRTNCPSGKGYVSGLEMAIALLTTMFLHHNRWLFSLPGWSSWVDERGQRFRGGVYRQPLWYGQTDQLWRWPFLFICRRSKTPFPSYSRYKSQQGN